MPARLAFERQPNTGMVKNIGKPCAGKPHGRFVFTLLVFPVDCRQKGRGLYRAPGLFVPLVSSQNVVRNGWHGKQ
jgi:hypothetical protein